MNGQRQYKWERLRPVQGALGQRIRALRKRLGISQEELADQAGLHWSYLARLERGELNPTLRNLVAVAAGLGVPVLELFRFEEPSRKRSPKPSSS